VFNPDFVQAVLKAKPHQRLRWHYFMLWQMIGVELWREAFIESPPNGSNHAHAVPAAVTEGA
jgi:hypothetical protein